jgi:uncharacterized protein YcaQ
MKTPTIQSLRSRAISHSLFEQTTLKDALDRLKFVQADPIRSPARAQDLILRQRVKDYRAGDLEREYPSLNLEEDFLYAYGFLTRDVWRHLHPRKTGAELTEFEKEILEIVRNSGEVHPRQLEAHFGSRQVVNAWGGYSKATTKSLENLHHRGFLRVVRRVQGIRVYEARIISTSEDETATSAAERLRKLIFAVANIFAPVTVKCLCEALVYLKRSLAQQALNVRDEIAAMVKSGELEKQTVDGIDYLTPGGKTLWEEAPRTVRILAPFDPLVWDRKRFEHFWGWAYRFEAYTPAAKRQRGYYAMPLLWCDRIIGWANGNVQNGILRFELGYVGGHKPADSDFSEQLELEVERLRYFLGLKN